MAEAGSAATGRTTPSSKLVTELKVTAHLMTLETGLFCIVQTPSARALDDGTGLPGVRISLPPGPASRPDAVSIVSFRPDGWMGGAADASLVRVTDGPAQVLVTIYQVPQGEDTAPRLQVVRLADESMVASGRPAVPAPGRASGAPARPAQAPAPAQVQAPARADIVAHVQLQGDVGARLGDWLGEPGSKRWIEGFAIAPTEDIRPQDIEYQAVLGRGWLSPWVTDGELCGSRGMALPILGLRARLRGKAADKFDITYTATFVDGTEIGPVTDGAPCEAESLSPIEAFKLVLRPRGKAAPATRGKPAMAAPAALLSEPDRKASEKPGASKKPGARAKEKAKVKVKPAVKRR
jgi:hypothetical protein